MSTDRKRVHAEVARVRAKETDSLLDLREDGGDYLTSVTRYIENDMDSPAPDVYPSSGTYGRDATTLAGIFGYTPKELLDVVAFAQAHGYPSRAPCSPDCRRVVEHERWEHP